MCLVNISSCLTLHCMPLPKMGVHLAKTNEKNNNNTWKYAHHFCTTVSNCAQYIDHLKSFRHFGVQTFKWSAKNIHWNLFRNVKCICARNWSIVFAWIDRNINASRSTPVSLRQGHVDCPPFFCFHSAYFAMWSDDYKSVSSAATTNFRIGQSAVH